MRPLLSLLFGCVVVQCATSATCRHDPPSKAFFSTLMGRASSGASLVLPGDPGWKLASKQFDADAPRAGAFGVFFAATPRDVQTVVELGFAQGVCLVPRSSGHSWAGYSVLPGKLVVDVSLINEISVLSKEQLLIRAGAGTNLTTLNTAMDSLNGAACIGDCPMVALGGYLTGGGEGYLQRWLGLGMDSVRAYDIVLANASRVNASATEHPDLYWALRGGGGPAANFGIVVSVELQLTALPAEGVLQFSFTVASDAEAVYQCVSRMFAYQPETDLSFGVNFQPSGELAVDGLWTTSSIARGRAALHRLTAGLPLSSPLSLNPMSFRKFQEGLFAVWGSLPDPAHINIKTVLIGEPLTGTQVNFLRSAIMQYASLNGTEGLFLVTEVWAYGGAVAKVPPEATAFPHRHAVADWEFGVGSGTPLPAHVSAWVDQVYAASVKLFAKEGIPHLYANMCDRDQKTPLQSYYADNLPRLQAIKKQVDPHAYWTAPQGIAE